MNDPNPTLPTRDAFAVLPSTGVRIGAVGSCPHDVACGPLDLPGEYSAYCKVCDPEHGWVEPSDENLHRT